MGFSSFSALVLPLLLFLPSQAALRKSLTEISELTLANSGQIQIILKEKEADAETARRATLLSNPSIQLQFGTITTQPQTGLTVEGAVTQSLPFPGKRSSLREIADAQRNLSDLTTQSSVTEIQHQAIIVSYEVAVLNELSLHSGERKKRFQLIHEYLNSHPSFSPVHQVEKLLIENQIRLYEKGIIELKQAQMSAKLSLSFLTGVSEEISPDIKWFTPKNLPDLAMLKRSALTQNLSLLKVKEEGRQFQQKLIHAKLSPYPDFILGAGARNEALDPSNRFYYGIIGFSLPIFDTGIHTQAEAQARYDSKTAEEEYLKRKLDRDVEEAFHSVEAEQSILKLFSMNAVAKEDLAFLKAEEQFRKNRIPVTLFLQLDTQVHDTIDSAFQVQLKLIEKWSRLNLLLGKKIEPEEL